ncbi:MAG TPA: DUF1573 domain-containing protein [Chitinophagaceae bacterium]|nr:DUF1573 domain-containing protein [Chitinophagaceae bacterium]
MKKISLLLVIVAGVIACKSTDKKTDEEKMREAWIKDSTEQAEKMKVLNDSTNFTSIQWLDSVYMDMGKVKEGQVVEVSYRFKNTGTKPLVIVNVVASCGCTVPEKPEEPIAPGEEGVIKAKFDSNGRKGENRKHITVDANTSPVKTHDLEFRVEVTDK